MLFSKKRYIGDKYEIDPNKCKRTNMGVVLKRRDNAPILKILYGGTIDRLMEEKNIHSALKYLEKGLMDLMNGKYPLETLVISKTLNGYYKNPK